LQDDRLGGRERHVRRFDARVGKSVGQLLAGVEGGGEALTARFYVRTEKRPV
jgi:hypothetical protein